MAIRKRMTGARTTARRVIAREYTASRLGGPHMVRRLSRASVMTSVVAGGLLVWTAGTAAQQSSNFVGGNPTQLDAKAVRTLRLRFPAGSRSNWHTHSHGQLLMVEQGRSRTQDRGGPVIEKGPG